MASNWQQGRGDGTSWDVTSPPDDTLTIARVVEALRDQPKVAELLDVGDLNTYLVTPEGDRREEEIAATFATKGLEDMAQHLLPRELR